MNYTSIEQSKKLLELGLSPDTADMYYNLGNSKIPNIIFGAKDNFRCYIPCWTAEALMKVMPEFKLCSYEDNTYTCEMIYIHNYYPMYNISILEAVYYAVCWLLENNYITKNK